MKDFTNFTKDWWQLIFKTEECLDLCKPLGSSSWEYYLEKQNKYYSKTDDEMIEHFGHTKRCGVCEIPMSNYESIR